MWWIVVISAVAVVAGYIAVTAAMGKRLAGQCVLMVKLGLAARLRMEFERLYDSETAIRLAASVTNRLFGEEPNEIELRGILREHSELVAQWAVALHRSKDLPPVVRHAIYWNRWAQDPVKASRYPT